jgi:hypothetical protein
MARAAASVLIALPFNAALPFDKRSSPLATIDAVVNDEISAASRR